MAAIESAGSQNLETEETVEDVDGSVNGSPRKKLRIDEQLASADVSLGPLSAEEETCKLGLMMLERLATSGQWVPSHEIQGFLYHTEPFSGARALFLAEAFNLDHSAKILCDAGAVITGKNNSGDTLLHVEVQQNRIGRVLLLREEASFLEIRNRYGMTPLHVAVDAGNTRCADLLLEAGADLNSRVVCRDGTVNGITTIGFSYHCHTMFLAKVPSRSNYFTIGITPLYIALRRKRDSCVKLLIDRGAKVNVADPTGESLLHWCARLGRADYAEWLIKAGAALNNTNNDGNTPLHICCDSSFSAPSCSMRGLLERREVLKLLVDSGACLETMNYFRQKADDIAAMQGNKEAYKILQEARLKKPLPYPRGKKRKYNDYHKTGIYNGSYTEKRLYREIM